jgi:hypothetical protein
MWGRSSEQHCPNPRFSSLLPPRSEPQQTASEVETPPRTNHSKLQIMRIIALLLGVVSVCVCVCVRAGVAPYYRGRPVWVCRWVSGAGPCASENDTCGVCTGALRVRHPHLCVCACANANGRCRSCSISQPAIMRAASLMQEGQPPFLSGT